jgi:hypothetical protein
MSLSDSHSDRPAASAASVQTTCSPGLLSSSRPAVSDPPLSGGAYYPKPAKSIIEECNHLNRSSS